MMHEEHDRSIGPSRGEEGHLVEVFDNHVERPVGKVSLEVAPRVESERIAPTHAVYFHAVQLGARCRPGKPRAKQGDAMPLTDDFTEHLVEVRFRAARLRILAVEPIDYEYVQAGEWSSMGPQPLSSPAGHACRVRPTLR